MRSRLLRHLVACAALVHGLAGAAAESGNKISFAVIAPPSDAAPDLSAVQDSILETDRDNLAFAVALGLKGSGEPCSDLLYRQRKDVLDGAKNGLIVSLSGSDWVKCRTADGKSAAVGRLNHLRDFLFTDELSLGGTRIPLLRQSAIPKFRSYAENARWELQDVMFATLNLPSDNNHYLSDAGRNSEFEDRTIANRDWVQRLFAHATRDKLRGIVIFCDGNPLAKPSRTMQRDGFGEIRRQILAAASKFPGQVLVVHRQPAAREVKAPAIRWRGNVGETAIRSGWQKISADPSTPMLFALESEHARTDSAQR